jgi:serine protease Do
MKLKALVGGLIAAGVITAAVGGYSQAGTPIFTKTRTETATAVATAPAAAQAPVTVALPDFSAIAERNGPAVVNITVSQEVKADAPMMKMPQMDPDDPFYEFFKRFQGPRGQMRPMPRSPMPQHALGSGFIVSPDGVILTNAHVVAGAKEVIVRLTDKREFKAKTIGIDRGTDVAVLKIDANDLPYVVIGNPETAKPGQWVAAIGSPFGMENTVTAGIISAKYRSLPDENYVPFIQTDVAVNPGNSGGPLLNTKGEVIGMNSQIYSNSGGYEGLSFAIPIDVAMKVKDQLVKYGKVERGRMGVTIQNLNQDLAKSFGLERAQGALVSSVEPDSPAAKAGVQVGDVILKFNGETISESTQLPGRVADLKPGTSAKLEVWRQGSTKELTVTVAAMKDAKVAAADDSAAKPQGKLGLAVRPLTPDEREQSGIKEGLVVESSDGPAARAGVQEGDVILSLNGTPVKSAEQLSKLVDKAGKNVALLVQRGEAKMFVPVQIG